MMLSKEVRESFLRYFAERNHRRVDSSSLVPGNDPTLLFTNAGMNQFKSVFTGEEKRDYRRATSSQRCVRAGGKHNDLENVGRTARHHTFFEMLGNFSFGDYFKSDAIAFAHELLVRTWGIDPSKLVYTVFAGAEGIPADDEARAIWKKVAGVGDDRVLAFGMADNFWQMGDTGPCGPCSEIHFHLGDHIPCARARGGEKCLGPACDCDRWIEIWNLVFMQYEKTADGERKSLPKPSIDTGMGLERVTAILQGKSSNYDTDLLRSLIDAAGELTSKSYGKNEENDTSLRVIADHIRASVFLIADGVYPSNIGRGFVLRRIMRRMIRHGRLLGLNEPRLFRLTASLARLMGEAFPLLFEREKVVTEAIEREEELFLQTLDRGMDLLSSELASLKGQVLPGASVFKLYDTFGFPPDLTELIAADRGVKIDQAGFEKEMAAQRERSRSASDFEAAATLTIKTATPTEFFGYETVTSDARVVETGTDAHGHFFVILDRTPFYAESGGQVGDSGLIESDAARVEIASTVKNDAGVYLHLAAEPAALKAGDAVRAQVDAERRLATERHHSATHLLHAALEHVLGDHVQQSGSYVGPDRLRFDFSHFKAMTPEEIAAVEKHANAMVLADYAVDKQVLVIDEAKKLGAKAFFGDKYGDVVRVVTVHGATAYAPEKTASREFCGGTHVRRTGEIGLIKIVSETAIAAGIRRIEALTGQAALGWVEETSGQLNSACRTLATPANAFLDRLQHLIDERKKLEKELEKTRTDAALSRADELLAGATTAGGVRLIAAFQPGLDANTLRALAERLQQKLGEGVVVLGSDPADDKGLRKAALCVAVSKPLAAKLKAGVLVGRLAKLCDGGGGGKPEMAQAGGKSPDKVPDAVKAAAGMVEEMLK